MKTFGEKLRGRLQTVRREKGPPAADQAAWRVEDELDGVRVLVEFEDIDKLGVRVRRLGTQKAAPAGGTAFDGGRLRRQAEEIVHRISYLTGELELIELDRQNGYAQVRSKRASGRQAGDGYFEILLSGNDAISLCRYRHADKSSAMARAAVAFDLTREIFERVVNDLVAVHAIP